MASVSRRIRRTMALADGQRPFNRVRFLPPQHRRTVEMERMKAHAERNPYRSNGVGR